MIRTFLDSLSKRILCLVGFHQWRLAGHGHPDSAYPEPFHHCVRCPADSRPTWAIQDEYLCRNMGLPATMYDPKDWSPRWR